MKFKSYINWGGFKGLFAKENRKKLVGWLVGLVIFWFFILPILTSTLWGLLTQETFTAKVFSATKSDQYPAIVVSPDENSGLNVTGNNEYKLLVRDVRSLLHWETRNERFDSVGRGDVICLTKVGVRIGSFSKYPTAVSYTRGACAQHD